MKKAFRLIAVLLAIVLTLQAAVLAADPLEDQTVLPDPGTTLGADADPAGEADPAEPEQPEEPEPIVITASMSNNQVVHSPEQSLRVQATQGGSALSPAQLRVELGGEVLRSETEYYSLRLNVGKNILTVSAETDTASAKLRLILRYAIPVPDGWAHDALEFCVINGILNGDTRGDLLPEHNATRAQLAAMMVRLFDAQPMASLDGYKDVPETAWYHDEMARAVAMGIFEGSGGKLTPDNPITREQAFTVLARAFGVAAATTDALAPFPDADLVSTWARSSVAGMLEAGYIHGSTSGKLNPAGNITRQELAQVLYNALDCITDDPEELSGSRCLYTGPIEALEDRALDGDLIVSCGDTGALRLERLRVGGRLALHLHSADSAVLGPVSGNISLCSPVKLELLEPVAQLSCLRDGASVTAQAEQALLNGGTLHGSYGSVTCLGGKSVIADDAEVSALHFGPNMSGRTLELNGSVDEVHADVRRLTIDGSGHINTLCQYRNGLTVKPEVGQREDRIDAGLEGVSIEQSEIPDAYYDLTTVTVSGVISGVNSEQAYGVPEDGRLCTVVYRLEGQIVKTERDFRLVDGAVLSCEVTPTLRYRSTDNRSVSVSISYGGETFFGELKLRANGWYTPLHQAQNIQTCKVQAHVNYTTGVYSTSSLSSWIGSVSGGSVVHYITSNGVSALIETSGGLRGWVPDSALRVSWQKYHNDDVEYSKEAKEAFVNQVHDYSSPTNYLIWCNLYTTTVNVFEGSKGNWKLIRSGECVIGTPETPTRVGVYSIYSHAYYWSFDDGVRLDNSRCYYASLFDGGIAFHTRLYYTATNTFVNSSLSAELSHGCVRCPDDLAKFIYYQCPLGTRVVVY